MALHLGLEMEEHEDEDDDEEEEASLLREVGGTSYRHQVNGDRTLPATNRSTVGTSFLKKVLMLITLAVVVLMGLRMYAMSGSNGIREDINARNRTKPHIPSPDSVPMDAPAAAPVPIVDNNDDTNDSDSENTPSATLAPVPGAVDNDDWDSDTDSIPSVTLAPDETKSLLYSQISTIVPDPFRSATPYDKAALIQQWGKWGFWDGDEDQRPTDDYCARYPNRDIPADAFPDTAWQVDAVFVNHLINDAEQLISRAMEAIFAEYGHGKPLPPEQLTERMQMFHWDRLDLSVGLENVAPPPKYTKRGDRGNGGWTTDRSQDGLIRRLLHAIMTNDSFTVVLGGHSAAAGHGNHFHQSYAMQFHRIMAPVFARLGVQLITRNLSQGGLGTLHNSMGAGSLYGSEIDLLLWDTGMTESSPAHIDLFLRQGLIGGNRVPVVWGGNFEVLTQLHEHAEVDIGDFGTGTDGVLIVTDETQAQSVPFAARFMKCDHDRQDLCDAEPRFCAHCWIPRDDIPNPEDLFEKIDPKPGSQVKWHPGWRKHQLVGRVLAFAVLDALKAAIEIFSGGTMSGPPLDEEFWHVTDYYENIREKIRHLDPSIGHCHEIASDLPARICNTPMQARSMYTPRANVDETSLTTVVKPAPPDNYVPRNEEVPVYDGPDVHNACDDLPEDAVDVYAIVAAGRERNRRLYSDIPRRFSSPTRYNTTKSRRRSLAEGDVLPGRGWQVYDEPPGQCDGEYHSHCKRSKSATCPMLGHHDARGMILGNEYSGWFVMELPNLQAGIVVLKLITERLVPELSTRTEGWTTVNDDATGRRLPEYATLPASRHLKKEEVKPIDQLPETFAFDFAVDGVVTTLNKEEFKSQLKTPQRVLEMLTVLDDPAFADAPRTVEVAFRMRGCGRTCIFGISHVYWA
jgi:hypothetical protein